MLISAHHQADTDVRSTTLIALLVILMTCGVPMLVGIAYVLAIAIRTGTRARPSAAWLVFGKRLLNGRPDQDFELRLQRLQALRQQYPSAPIMILGGRLQGDSRSEARAGAEYLESLAGAKLEDIQLEEGSRDTLENLRNARVALHSRDGRLPLTLVSSRYHLARCGVFAKSLGLSYELCAAESSWRWSWDGLLHIFTEASYVCWFAIGKRWAQLIGNERMMKRIT